VFAGSYSVAAAVFFFWKSSMNVLWPSRSTLGCPQLLDSAAVLFRCLLSVSGSAAERGCVPCSRSDHKELAQSPGHSSSALNAYSLPCLAASSEHAFDLRHESCSYAATMHALLPRFRFGVAMAESRFHKSSHPSKRIASLFRSTVSDTIAKSLISILHPIFRSVSQHLPKSTI
jgi:hypothetical protein